MQINIVANSTSPSKPKTHHPNSIATRRVELFKNSNLKRYNDMLHVCGYELSSRVILVPIVRSRTHELGGEQVSKITCMTVGL
jgi:hypothetical protein